MNAVPLFRRDRVESYHGGQRCIDPLTSTLQMLEQGGLIYPVESVITDRAWYCTFPEGSVQVRAAE